MLWEPLGISHLDTWPTAGHWPQRGMERKRGRRMDLRPHHSPDETQKRKHSRFTSISTKSWYLSGSNRSIQQWKQLCDSNTRNIWWYSHNLYLRRQGYSISASRKKYRWVYNEDIMISEKPSGLNGVYMVINKTAMKVLINMCWA